MLSTKHQPHISNCHYFLSACIFYSNSCLDKPLQFVEYITPGRISFFSSHLLAPLDVYFSILSSILHQTPIFFLIVHATQPVYHLGCSIPKPRTFYACFIETQHLYFLFLLVYAQGCVRLGAACGSAG